MTYKTANRFLNLTTVFERSSFVPDEGGNPCWVYFTGEVLAHWRGNYISTDLKQVMNCYFRHVTDLPRVFDLMRVINQNY